MISIKINKKFYTLITRWDELTIREAIPFHNICKNLPESLREKYKLIFSKTDDIESELNKWDKILTDEDLKDLYRFYDRVIIFFTGIDASVLNQTNQESKTILYLNYMDSFVFGMINSGAGYMPLEINSFEFGDHKYYLPASKIIGDHEELGTELMTVQFCESADLISYISDHDQGFKYAAYIVAILCLKENEDYYEDVIVRRSNVFKDLPMDIVWEVFYNFSMFYSYITKRFPSVFSSKGRVNGKTLNSGWQGFMLDIYSKSNYLLTLNEIKEERMLKWLEVKDRESEIINYQNTEK